MEPFDFSQLYDHFFRPDLVKLKLSGDEKAYQKAIAGMSYKEALKNPPPKLEFKELDANVMQKDEFDYKDVSTNKREVEIGFNVKESGSGGIGLIRVYQEGKLIKTIGNGKINKQSANLDILLEQTAIDNKAKEKQKVYLSSAKKLSKAINRDYNLTTKDIIKKYSLDNNTTNKAGVYKVKVELKSGKNDISIEAFNITNTVTSYREHLTINTNIPKTKPTLYAIVAGVNKFEAENVDNLHYSINDAKAIKDILEKKSKDLYKEVNAIYMK